MHVGTLFFVIETTYDNVINEYDAKNEYDVINEWWNKWMVYLKKNYNKWVNEYIMGQNFKEIITLLCLRSSFL